MAQLALYQPVSVRCLLLPLPLCFHRLLQGGLSCRLLLPDIVTLLLFQPAAFGKGTGIIERGLLEPRTAHAGGERVHVVERVTTGIKRCLKTMTGHGDIGQVPVHGGGRHDEGPVDGCPLCLVNGGGVTVIKELVIFWTDSDPAAVFLSACTAVEPQL